MNLMYWVTVAILIFAVSGSASLSKNDWKKKSVCPKLMGIPACYIVFGFFWRQEAAIFLILPTVINYIFGLWLFQL